MSSTNRSGQHYTQRKANSDYYVTPVAEITKFLDALYVDQPQYGRLLTVLDPCAGGDRGGGHEMSYPVALRRSKFNVVQLDTMDIRQDSLAERKKDYLTAKVETQYDMIITNPPFLLAKEIILKGMQEVKQGGLVIMLLRLNFFGSAQWRDFWRNQMPTFCYVHSKRMKFTEAAGTDSVEYMHCVWERGNNPVHTRLSII